MNEPTLSDQDRKEIVRYRLEKAQTTYSEAVANIDMGFAATAANRLYYAAYYAVSALLIAYGYTARTHDGVKRMLGLHFLKIGLLDASVGRTFNVLFTLRQTGDYEDRKNLDLETEIAPLAQPARQLIESVSQLAKDRLSIS